jgi:hypothetical protein
MTSQTAIGPTSPVSAPPAVERFEDVTDHRGERRGPDYELFVPPPPEIGKIASAESTLKLGKTEHPLLNRVFLVLVPAVLSAGAVQWLARNESRDDQQAMFWVSIALAVAVFVTIGYFTRFVHRCSYVGDDGVATFLLKGCRRATPKGQVLLFTQAAELRASQTRHFLNGVYTGTFYDYRWSDAAGRRIFRLKGKYQGKDKPPKPLDAFHFASAADVAWSTHYLDRAQAQLEREGSIAFGVDRGRVVRVGPGFMEFHFGGEPVRVTREEIGAVNLGGGTFSFKHKDAKWYRSAGKFNFPYGQMANGKVFFLVLEKLMGYRWD